MALSPAPDDPNREKELERKKKEPDQFADFRLKEELDKAEREKGKR